MKGCRDVGEDEGMRDRGINGCRDESMEGVDGWRDEGVWLSMRWEGRG